MLLTEKKLGICSLVLAFLMGISRLYFYVHFPTDVLAGMVLWPALRICRGIFDEKADEERLMKMAKKNT